MTKMPLSSFVLQSKHNFWKLKALPCQKSCCICLDISNQSNSTRTALKDQCSSCSSPFSICMLLVSFWQAHAHTKSFHIPPACVLKRHMCAAFISYLSIHLFDWNRTFSIFIKIKIHFHSYSFPTSPNHAFSRLSANPIYYPSHFSLSPFSHSFSNHSLITTHKIRK